MTLDTERERLWRAALAEKDSLDELIEQRAQGADLYRAKRRTLDEIINGERPPSNTKLREYFEGHTNDFVWQWLQDMTDKQAEYAADLFLMALRGRPTSVREAHKKVMAEIREGIGHTSNTHDNIANRIVRKQYRD